MNQGPFQVTQVAQVTQKQAQPKSPKRPKRDPIQLTRVAGLFRPPKWRVEATHVPQAAKARIISSDPSPSFTQVIQVAVLTPTDNTCHSPASNKVLLFLPEMQTWLSQLVWQPYVCAYAMSKSASPDFSSLFQAHDYGERLEIILAIQTLRTKAGARSCLAGWIATERCPVYSAESIRQARPCVNVTPINDTPFPAHPAETLSHLPRYTSILVSTRFASPAI